MRPHAIDERGRGKAGKVKLKRKQRNLVKNLAGGTEYLPFSWRVLYYSTNLAGGWKFVLHSFVLHLPR